MKKYTYNEVLEASTKYFDGDELAGKVFVDKYALRNNEGEYLELDPSFMHKRLAKELARMEAKFPNPISEERIYDLLKNFKYIVPQGSPMAAIGNYFQIQSLGNCFVIEGINNSKLDSYGGIMKADQELAQIFKRRGGCGLDISGIRPQGMTTQNAAKTTDGIGVFMERFSNTCREVGQCLGADTKVLTQNGLKKISKIKVGEKVWTNQQWVNVSNVVKNKKKTVKLITKYGKEIVASKDHVLHTVNGEKPIRDLSIGDSITQVVGIGWHGTEVKLKDFGYKKSSRSNKNITLPRVLDTDLAYLLGQMYGDGFVMNKNDVKTGVSISFSQDWKLILKKCKEITKKSFNKDINVTDGDGRCFDGSIFSREIVNFLENNKILKQKADKIVFPQKLLSAKQDVIFSFISGYFDADGSVNAYKKQYKFSSINKQFLLEVQNVLNSFGVFSKIHREKRINPKWKDLFSLVINGQKSQDIFRNLMKESIKVNSYKFQGKKRDYTKTIYKIADFNSKRSNHKYIINNNQYLSYSTTDRVNKDLGTNKNVFLAQDYVKSISEESATEVDVYDLVLDKEHLFFANGLYVHNSGRRGAEMQTICVQHPEIETFINIKNDLTKVTGANISIKLNDEFMNAVKNNEDYVLRYPVDCTPENAKFTKTVKAKELWDKIIHSAWFAAEPGLLFWDTVVKNTPADIYTEEGFGSISTNPCLAGDTLIAVADGRNYVSIKELALQEKDVPVYSVDKRNGNVSIKTGRHPRLTGTNQKLLRIHLDDQSYFDVTPNHKCLLRNGATIQAKDLKPNDSLCRFDKVLKSVKKDSKPYYAIKNNTINGKFDFEHRLISKFHQPEKWNELYSELQNNGFIKGGVVVHHKDYNQLNNSIDNLEIMSFKDHTKLHGDKDNNGENNGKYCGISSKEIKEKALDLTKKINRRFSTNEWFKFAKKNNLPQTFSSFRKNELGTISNLAKECATQLNIEDINLSTNLVKTKQKMLEQGYNTVIKNNSVLVEKKCELCNNNFFVSHLQREQSFCSLKCSCEYINNDKNIVATRKNNASTFAAKKSIDKKQKQLEVFSNLKFTLGRKPSFDEWCLACKNNNVPYRVGKNLKYSFKSFTELKQEAETFNHKVVKVEELEGLHDVYNITVDDNHTVGLITKTDNGIFSGIYVGNCGEIVLSKNDSCRLLVLNLASYVKNEFTKSAYFDFDLFFEHTVIAQRLMDDIVELEFEHIDRILAKIDSDPEPEYVKTVERKLWQDIKETSIKGRRTGLGLTALGDCLAKLNVTYGSEESIEWTENIYKALARGATTSTVTMAKERGAFPVFSYEKEKDHEFLNRAMSLCSDEIQEWWKFYGRRNIALTTSAPCGSVALLTRTTSGIEPVFLNSYIRRKKVLPGDKDSKVDMIDALGDKWQEFTVYHYGINEWMKVTEETDITKSPYHKATSADINWLNSVRMQAAAQKYIEHSISKTCNLPNNVTEELVSEIYMKAWETGCKGFTIYRDGCRKGVLVNVSEAASNNVDGRPKDVQIVMAPKRPVELVCDIKKAKINGEAWTIFVGLLNGKPYEIFGGLSKYVDIPNKYKIGKIAKNGKNQEGLTTYNLIIGEQDDEMVIKDISSIFENKTNEAFTRMISLNLRHGTPIQYVVEQLTKDKYAEITSFTKVISRVLKSYIKDGTKSFSEKKCPNCGADNSLIYQEGCVSCLSCKYSKCG